MTTRTLSMSAPEIDETDVAAVAAVLRSGRLALGPRAAEFETRLAAYVGAGHAVALSSGTAALHLGLLAVDVEPGAEVIVPSLTFAATVHAVFYVGARPVFAEVLDDTGTLDPRCVAGALTPRTRAIVPVDLYGHPAQWDELEALSSDAGVPLIADACEALGAEYRGRKVGTFGAASTFAFYPNKQITTGEGGALVTDDSRLAATVRRLRNHGRDADDVRLDHTALGYNYRMSEMAAALGVSQLARFDRLLARRVAVASAYDRAFEGVEGLAPAPRRADARVSPFVYVVRLDPSLERERFEQALAARGVPTRRYFPPVHLMPHVRERCGSRPGQLPVTEALAARSVALPFHGGLAPEDVERVADACRQAVTAA